MKIHITIFLLFLSTFMFSQTTIELLQDSCEYLGNYILLDSNKCECSFELITDDLTFEITDLNKKEKSLFFSSELPSDELDSLSLHYSLFLMDSLKHELVDIGLPEKPIQTNCGLVFKVSKKYRNFYQILVTGNKNGCARIVTFNVQVYDHKIITLSSSELKSSTYN